MSNGEVIALKSSGSGGVDHQRLSDAAPSAALIAVDDLGCARIATGTGGALTATVGHRRAAAVPLHRLRLLHASAEPGRGDHPVRRLSGHRPRDRPALGHAMDDAQEGCRARQQLHFRQDQGQRPARQSDRDGGTDRLACCRHGAGAVRRRRLPHLRERAGRSGDPDHRLALSLRRFRAPRSHAARQSRRGRRRAAQGIDRAARGRRASPSTNAASRTSPMRRRSPGRCSAGSRRRPSSRRARPSSKARSEWSKWRSKCSSEKNVVELDDERRAAMVSNLMVVLCGERDTQPVVNTGTLYT